MEDFLVCAKEQTALLLTSNRTVFIIFIKYLFYKNLKTTRRQREVLVRVRKCWVAFSSIIEL